MRYFVGLVCVLALAAGCETTGGGGNGGSGGMPECQSAEDCNDGNACTENTCIEGVCECAPVEDGSGCDFGPLGPFGVCVVGECTFACETAENCDDGNDCTEDACPIDGGGLCDHTPVTDGTTCAGGSCQSGACELAGLILPCSEQGVRNAVAAGGGPYTFDCGGPKTVVTRANIVVVKDVILDGEGNLTLDGNRTHGVFTFSSRSNGCRDTPPCESEVRVEISGVTITGGMPGASPVFNVGECVDVQLTRSSVSGNAGRGIENAGTLTLTDVTVSDNEEQQGIFNFGGTLTMTNCTVSGNMDGGGITGGGTLTMTNCTVSGNAGPRPEGGGIAVGGTVTMTNCTVSGNTGRDIVFRGGTLTMMNTLVDGACVNEIATMVTFNGYNIESPGNTCGFDQATDQVNVSAEALNLEWLGILRDNGGPTMTHALGWGSVAIDVIPAAECVDADGARLTTDQTGAPRPEMGGTMCDVGAFEFSRCGVGEPDPWQPGEERLSVGVFYECGRSETIFIDDVTTNYFIFVVDENNPSETLTYRQGTLEDRLEGRISDVITLLDQPFWGGGVIWFEPIDLSAWTTMFVAFKSSDPSFATFDIALQSGEGENPTVFSLDPRNYGYTNDGEWHFLQIPLQDAIDLGWDPSTARSPFIFSAPGGNEGDVLLIDNLYFTKD